MHALITGASSGIGEAMANHLAELGWDLTLVARRETRLRELSHRLQTRTTVRSADLEEVAVCDDLVEKSQEDLGPIDVLLNNAGVQYVEPTVGVEVKRIERLLAVNLVSPLALIHLVLPAMLERGKGTIVNVSSVAGLTPTPGMCHYNASKAGLAAASESLRVELKSTGINVLTVYPGPISTDMSLAAKAAYEDNLLVRTMPTGDARVLARLICRAIVNNKPRLFYPKVYAFHRYARLLNQWITDRFIPPLRDREKLSGMRH